MGKERNLGQTVRIRMLRPPRYAAKKHAGLRAKARLIQEIFPANSAAPIIHKEIIDSVPDPMFVIDRALRIRMANRSFCSIFKIKINKAEQGSGPQLRRDKNFLPLRRAIRRTFSKNAEFATCDFECVISGRGARAMHASLNRIGIANQKQENHKNLVLVTLRDVTEEKRVSEDLAKAALRLGEAQDIARLGSWEWDLKTHKGSASRTAYDILGIADKKLFPGKEYLAELHPEDRMRVRGYFKKAIDDRTPFKFEHRIIRPDGNIRRVFVIGRALRGRDDALKLRGTIQDITEQRKLQDKLSEYAKRLEEKVQERTSAVRAINMRLAQEKVHDEALLDSIGDGVISTDIAGRITLVNRRAAEMLGWEWQTMIGKPIVDVLPMQDGEGNALPESDRPSALVLKTGKRIASDPSMSTHYYVRRNNTRFPISFAQTPVILGGKAIGTIQVFRDVTKSKAMDRAKTEFVSLASHQLRTPLSVISMYTELLKKRGAEPAESLRAYVGEIHAAVRRMSDLINDLLNVTRIDTETLSMALEPVDLVQVAEGVLKEFEFKMQEKEIAFTKRFRGKFTPFLSDRHLVQITFQNLLANAVKYTPRGGSVALTVENSAGRVTITIKDTGYGIPEHQQAEIFKKLFRADNAKMIESEGTGLGLYIVKSIVERLGGTISFISRENEGSAFTVALPTKKIA